MMKEIFPPDAFLFKVLPKATPLAGVTYVPSRFAFSFECDGRQYVTSTLTKQCLEAVLPEKVKAGEGFDSLIETYMLVPEGKDEVAFYESISSMMRLFSKKKKISGFVILPTLHCNARCVYCYEEGRAQSKMSPETVEAALRYILDNCDRNGVKLNWFGGEPLLCPEIIDRISDGLKEAGIPYRSNVVTNGSLITPEILEKMQGPWHTRNIQVSMDGAEPDYIARKRYYGDLDAYHAVMENISKLSEAGITVALRVNVDEGNWAGIPQFLNDLKQWVDHKECVHVYFSPLMAVRAGEGDIAFWKKVLAANPLIAEAGFKPLPYTEPVMKFRIHRCMADSGSVVIGPDGGLYPCEHCAAESCYGNIVTGTIDTAAREEYCRTDRTRAMCRECPMLPECTSFANCPWVDYHCRESHEMLAAEALRRIIRHQQTITERTDEDDLIC